MMVAKSKVMPLWGETKRKELNPKMKVNCAKPNLEDSSKEENPVESFRSYPDCALEDIA